jgi:hypothetical protein
MLLQSVRSLWQDWVHRLLPSALSVPSYLLFRTVADADTQLLRPLNGSNANDDVVILMQSPTISSFIFDGTLENQTGCWCAAMLGPRNRHGPPGEFLALIAPRSEPRTLSSIARGEFSAKVERPAVPKLKFLDMAEQTCH